MGFIYKIVNLTNGKIYIGKTIKDITKRFHEHIVEAKRYAEGKVKYNTRLYPAMIKYGFDNFRIELVEEVISYDINERERYYIKEFRSLDPNIGYNISPGGLGGPLFKGHKHSLQTRQKMHRKASLEFCENRRKYMLGRKLPKSSDTKSKRPIICIETQKIYKNQILAREELGYNVIPGLRHYGGQETCHGYHFAYIDDKENLEKFKKFIGKEPRRYNNRIKG